MRAERTTAPAVTVVTGTSVLAGALVARLTAAGRATTLLARPLADADAVTAQLPGGAAVVHLAAGRDPSAPEQELADDVAVTAALLEGARAAGVRRVVLVTSTDVHRARPGQVPLPESAPVAAPAGPSLVGAWVETERLADHARRTGLDVVVVRPAALAALGPALDGAVLRALSAPRLLAVRGVEPLWQLCAADDLVAALELAAAGRIRRACAVASQGWLTQAEVERLAGRRRLELPAAVVLSTAERLHRVGVAPGGPADLDALLAPVVVEPARLRAAGWRPAWTAEQVLRAHLAVQPTVPPAPPPAATAYAAGTAGATAAVLGTAALVRRARRRRRR